MVAANNVCAARCPNQLHGTSFHTILAQHQNSVRDHDVTQRRLTGPMPTDITGKRRQLGPSEIKLTVFFIFLPPRKAPAMCIRLQSRFETACLTRGCCINTTFSQFRRRGSSPPMGSSNSKPICSFRRWSQRCCSKGGRRRRVWRANGSSVLTEPHTLSPDFWRTMHCTEPLPTDLPRL